MTDLTFFPDGDQIWFISHIDGYVKPHKGIESTSVRCYLTSIPADIGDDPSKLSKSQIATIFGRENSASFTTTIFAGALPSYAVGFAFQCERYVGCKHSPTVASLGWMQDERVSVTAAASQGCGDAIVKV